MTICNIVSILSKKPENDCGQTRAGHSHVALMGVDAVKQSFWRHPLHRQTTLRQHIHSSHT